MARGAGGVQKNRSWKQAQKIKKALESKKIVGVRPSIYDFRTPPPPINFVHNNLFFSKIIIILELG